MVSQIKPRDLAIGAALAFLAWVYLYATIWLANAIWPAAGAIR